MRELNYLWFNISILLFLSDDMWIKEDKDFSKFDYAISWAKSN